MEVSRVWFLSGDTHICVFMSLYSQAHTQGSTDVYVKVQIVPRWLSGKESACQWGDTSLIPGSGRSPGEENGNPLQYSCLENSMDRGAWWAIVPGVKKDLDTTECPNNNRCFIFWGFGARWCPSQLLTLLLKCQLKTKTRKTQPKSCELTFIWGRMRTTALETASQIALRNCSEEARGKVSQYYIWCYWRGYMQSITDFGGRLLPVKRNRCHY